MRTFLKYFILFTFQQACKGSTKQVAEENTPLYAELVVLIDEQLNTLKRIMTEDVTKLNQLIHEKTLPVIGVKKD